jgi:hypothetical protein
MPGQLRDDAKNVVAKYHRALFSRKPATLFVAQPSLDMMAEIIVGLRVIQKDQVRKRRQRGASYTCCHWQRLLLVEPSCPMHVYHALLCFPE